MIMIIHRLKHLLFLYRDLSEHKKHGRIKDFKLHWKSYDVYIQPVDWVTFIPLDLKLDKSGCTMYTLEKISYELIIEGEVK